MAGIAEIPELMRRVEEIEKMTARIIDELNQHYKKHHMFKKEAIA